MDVSGTPEYRLWRQLLLAVAQITAVSGLLTIFVAFTKTGDTRLLLSFGPAGMGTACIVSRTCSFVFPHRAHGVETVVCFRERYPKREVYLWPAAQAMTASTLGYMESKDDIAVWPCKPPFNNELRSPGKANWNEAVMPSCDSACVLLAKGSRVYLSQGFGGCLLYSQIFPTVDEFACPGMNARDDFAAFAEHVRRALLQRRKKTFTLVQGTGSVVAKAVQHRDCQGFHACGRQYAPQHARSMVATHTHTHARRHGRDCDLGIPAVAPVAAGFGAKF